MTSLVYISNKTDTTTIIKPNKSKTKHIQMNKNKNEKKQDKTEQKANTYIHK